MRELKKLGEVRIIDAGILSGNYFSLLDQFTTDESAPISSPRMCEPGPGSFTLFQNDGQFEISGGKLFFPSQATVVWGDLGFTTSPMALFTGHAIRTNATITTAGIGVICGLFYLGSLAGGGLEAGAYLNNTFHPGNFTVLEGAGIINSMEVLETETAEDYKIVTVYRGNGSYVFVKGNSFSDWTLLYATVTTKGNYCSFGFNNRTIVGTISEVAVKKLAGPFGTSNGYADYYITNPSAGVSEALAGNNNLIALDIPSVISGDVPELSFRYIDDNNRWILRYTVATKVAQLVQVEAGVETVQSEATMTYNYPGRCYLAIKTVDDNIGYYVGQNAAGLLRGTFESSLHNTAEGIKSNIAGSSLAVYPRIATGLAATVLDSI